MVLYHSGSPAKTFPASSLSEQWSGSRRWGWREQVAKGGGGDTLTSSTTSDKEMLRNLHLPRGLRRRRATYGVGAPRQ